jgi:hypothetical protein
MGQSFDITNSRDFLEQLVVPSFEELEKQPTSSRAAITAAIFCWHLRDWVWAQHKPYLKALGVHTFDELTVHLIAKCPAFEAIQGIANGSKHFRSKRQEPTSTTRQWSVFGTLALWNYTSLDVEFKGNTVLFIDLLKDCVLYWNVFFNQHFP